MLIPWSGGLDSTLVLYYALDYWYNRDKIWKINNGFNEFIASESWQAPRTISIESNQINERQQILQKKSRDKLISFFNKKGWHFTHDEFKIDTNGMSNGINGQFCQPIMWITQCSLFVKEEPLLMGWIRGDDASHYLDKFYETWKLLTKLNGKNSDLVLPLFEFRKYDIIKECKLKGILNKCWYCENPTIKNKSCNKCECCLTMMSANMIRSHLDKTDFTLIQ